MNVWLKLKLVKVKISNKLWDFPWEQIVHKSMGKTSYKITKPNTLRP